jgi:hypothetical protein
VRHWNPEHDLALDYTPEVRLAPITDEVVPNGRRLAAWSLAGLGSLGLWALIYQGVQGVATLAGHFL